jgi:CubicO group peptidase (beta-lactamase class C family)
MSIVKLKYPVGSKFEYNNANYNILGLIAEAASGEPYSRYVQNHIFNPLEMSHSFTSKADSQQHGLAVGYRYWFGQPIPAPNLEVPLNALPSGQLICSAEDIAHYLIAQLNGGCYGNTRILSEAGIDEMHNGAAKIKEMGLSLGSYAMGWIEEKIGQSRIISHSGIVPDFGGFMAIVPEQKKGIVLLYNANHAMMKMTFDEFGLHAAQLLAGEKPAADKLGAAPWLMRSMLLIPIPQIALFATSLRQLNHWRANSKASLRRRRKQHALLPLALNLLPAVTLVPLMGKMRGFIELFMPDYAWLSRICGGFAMLWSFLRTGWILRSWRKG